MPDVTEERLPVESNLYADVYVPEASGPLPLAIVAHGYGGEKSSMLRLGRRIFGEELALASLQGPHAHLIEPADRSQPLGYGFGWVTNFKPAESVALHHRAIQELVGRLSARGAVDPGRIFLLGFSQSVAVNFRFAFTRPEGIRGVVGICGGIPGDWDDPKYRSAEFDVLVIGGRQDEFYPPERIEANAEKLRRRARNVDVRIFEKGHEIPPEAHAAIREWVARRV
jgi:phospholipase/carboxylesterase